MTPGGQRWGTADGLGYGRSFVRCIRTPRVVAPCGGGGGRGSCGQTSNDPGNNQHNPQYANYWAPLTRKRHIPPHPAQPRHTKYWAPRTRKRHQQEHRPQRPTESSDPTQHAKGRTGDCPGPRKGATTRRTVTRGVPGAISGRQHKVTPPPLSKQRLFLTSNPIGGGA